MRLLFCGVFRTLCYKYTTYHLASQGQPVVKCSRITVFVVPHPLRRHNARQKSRPVHLHGPALIGSALFLYQFLAHRCAILYTRLFSPVLFPAYSFLSPRKVGAFAGPSRLYSCVAGRQACKNRRCFALSLGVVLYTGSFFGTDAAAICWLTFPLGSDTISIKHRKGRPAPWPSS